MSARRALERALRGASASAARGANASSTSRGGAALASLYGGGTFATSASRDGPTAAAAAAAGALGARVRWASSGRGGGWFGGGGGGGSASSGAAGAGARELDADLGGGADAAIASSSSSSSASLDALDADALADAMRPVAAVADLKGEVIAIAADSWITTAGLMYVIEYFHLAHGMEWYAAIAAATCVMRVCAFPLTIMQQKSAGKMHLAKPEMTALQESINEARRAGEHERAARLGRVLYTGPRTTASAW